MLRQADRTERRGIRMDSWFSWPPDRVDRYTTWSVGPLTLERHRATGHLDLQRTIPVERRAKWKLTVERERF